MHLSLPAFGGARVLVAGDLMLDRYWQGQTQRISPEAPVPVVHVQAGEDRPGGAGNVALNIRSLGAEASLLSLVGDDEAADRLRRSLEAAGVRCLLEVVEGSHTITKLRVLSRHQQLIRLDFEDGFSAADSRRLQVRFDEALRGADVVVFSDYYKGCLRAVEPLIAAARARGLPVLVDPKGRDFGRYRGATLLKPNEAELALVVGPWQDEDELLRKARDLVRDLALEALLLTRSERGMLLVQRDGARFETPTRAREVFDVTGAGDTVIGVLSAALAAGARLPEATGLANAAAGVVVGRLGAASVSAAELQRAITPRQPPLRGVLSEPVLIDQRQAARDRGETVVMTNGCFDLLHAGHVRYLQAAKALGDRLIVAVNGDASVARLKGPARPINGLEQRMDVLAALACVDWVVPFGADTPRELICRVLPDLLVKGGDYRPEDIAGSDCVWEAGGEVRVLDFVPGCSTSDTLERIRSAPAGATVRGQ